MEKSYRDECIDDKLHRLDRLENLLGLMLLGSIVRFEDDVQWYKVVKHNGKVAFATMNYMESQIYVNKDITNITYIIKE